MKLKFENNCRCIEVYSLIKVQFGKSNKKLFKFEKFHKKPLKIN